MGTSDRGILVLDRTSGKIEPYIYGLDQPLFVREFQEDAAGNLWIGTEDAGLFYFDVSENRSVRYAFRDKLKYHNIHALLLDGETLWIGYFSQGLDMVDLPSGNVTHFSSYDDIVDEYNTMTSFTIEFYLNPYRVRMNSQVLSKMAIYNDNGATKYSGIRANIINGRLVWQFNNLFSYNGVYTNVMLSQGEYLKENEWRHHSISFDASTGKLVKYIDGLEEEVVYLTSTGDKTGSPYIAEFDNIKLDPLYLGQGFIGGMDLFYFTPTYKQNFNLYRYSLDGEIISKVIDFNDKNTFIDAINYTGKYTNGSYIDLYYRTSDYYFAPDDDNIAWQLLDSDINTNVSNSNSVRYMQIRAVLKSNVDRNITPTLNNVDIVYHKGRLPQVPVNLTATAVNNNSVVLRWEGDHKDIVGYKIYYGTKSGVYNEAEHTPIIVGNQNEYYVEGLKENEVYYFTITAIGGESGDIESGFSKEVYVRAVH